MQERLMGIVTKFSYFLILAGAGVAALAMGAYEALGQKADQVSTETKCPYEVEKAE